MKADTFAKLIVLETLIDAEMGRFLESPPESMDGFREEIVARISDRIDEIDVLDAVAAARVYDAIVDYLADLSDDSGHAIEATLRFKRAVDRIADRGLNRRDRAQPATWAIVLDELLEELANVYHEAVRPDGTVVEHEYGRVLTLLSRAREVSERMLWTADAERQADVREGMDRLTFAVRHQRLRPTEIDQMIRPAQRDVRRYRPSTLTRVGTFVLSQLLRRQRPVDRDESQRFPEPRIRSPERGSAA
jgi:hypothetical protein